MVGCRPTKLLKLMVATNVLVGSIASTPTFGHAHALPTSLHHDHRDSDSVEHSHRSHSHGQLATSHDDDDDAIVLAGRVFHLHGTWFGIPFTIPAPAERHNGDDGRRLPLADSCLMSLTPNSATGVGPVRERPGWSDSLRLAPDLGAGLQLRPFSPLDRPALTGAVSQCALQARSGVLRW